MPYEAEFAKAAMQVSVQIASARRGDRPQTPSAVSVPQPVHVRPPPPPLWQSMLLIHHLMLCCVMCCAIA
jgi:hypothetical protein